MKSSIYALFRNMLDSPHQYAAAILAKLSVNVATILWCVVVLWKDSALGMLRGYDGMLYIAGENQWALLLLLLATISLCRLLMDARPIGIGVVAYGSLAMFWVYLWCLEVTGDAVMRPGRFAALSVVASLAMFAFMANPKRQACDGITAAGS